MPSPFPRVASALLLLIPGIWVPRSALADRLFVESLAFPYDGTPVTELVLGDLDLDGLTDLVMAGDQAGTGEIHVFLGRDGPSFAHHHTLRDGGSILAIALGRMDGDEYPDLVAVNSGRSSISVFLNSKDGRLGAPRHSQVGIQPRTVALADFDQDGNLDAASSSLLAARVDILLGNGLGELGSPRSVDTGDSPHAMLAGDFDGDLIPDLVVAQTDGVSFLRGLGRGDFMDPVLSPAGIPRFMAPGDLNSDGLLDLAILITPPRSLAVLFNLGQGSFRAETLEPQASAQTVAMFDLDRDGDQDVVTRTPSAVRSHSSRSDGTFDEPIDHHLEVGMKGFALSDLNADGAPDIVFTREDTPEVRVSLAPAPGLLGARHFVDLEEGPQDLVRLRGRAAATLVAASPRKLHVLGVDRHGVLVRSTVSEYPGSAFVDAAAGDFDGDGLDEIALADTAKNQAFVVSLDDAGAAGRTASYEVAGFPAKLAAGDLNRDGLLDLAVSDLAYPAITLIRGPLMEGKADVLRLPVPSGQKAIEIADLNGDGIADIAASLGSGLLLLLGDPAGQYAPVERADLPSAWELRAADIDGDGSMDLAGTSGSRVEILLGVASARDVRRVEVQFPVDVRALEVVDIDQDGRLDLLTGTPKDLQVIRNSGSGTFSDPDEYLGAGGAPRGFVVEDLNRDGGIDVAVAAFLSRAVVVVPGLPRPAFRRGDTTADGIVGLTDAIVILDSLFRGGGALSCPDAGDANDSGTLDLTDPVYLLLHLFQGGPEPPAPGALECGADPSVDELAGCGAPCPRV